MRVYLIFVLSVILAACSEGSNDHLSSIQNSTEQSNVKPDQPLLAQPEPATETLGELLAKLDKSPNDVQPQCTLNWILNNRSPDGLRKFRQRWMNKRIDSHYILAPSLNSNRLPPYHSWNCVCPGICIAVLQDTQTPEPKNYSVIRIHPDSPKKGEDWLVRNINLSGARLYFGSSTPYFSFGEPGSDSERICAVIGSQCKFPDGIDLFNPE